MKTTLYLVLLFGVLFISSCKKSTLTKKLNNSSWELKQVLRGDEDVTASILKSKVFYSSLVYSKNGNEVTLGNPNREELKEEKGTWTLEKIVPTVGDRYYLIRNSVVYKYNRNIFNINDYGSEMRLTKDKVLTQYIDEYTVIYKKVN